jgi:AraC-like DNA-binding protein
MAGNHTASLVDWLAGSNAPTSSTEITFGVPLVRMAHSSISLLPTSRESSENRFPELTVQMLTRGRLPFSGDMGFGRFRAVANPGDFIVTPAGQSCKLRPEADLETVGLAVSTAVIHDLIAPAFDGLVPDLAPLHAGVLRSDRVTVAMRSLWANRSVRGNLGQLLMQSDLLTVLTGLVASALEEPRATPLGGLAPFRLKQACEMLDASDEIDISIISIAAEVGLSPSYFTKAFKRSTGRSPAKWLAQRRVDLAKQLLQENKLSLSEIAGKVGFAAQPQFTTAFRKMTGLTPKRWRAAQLF